MQLFVLVVTMAVTSFGDCVGRMERMERMESVKPSATKPAETTAEVHSVTKSSARRDVLRTIKLKTIAAAASKPTAEELDDAITEDPPSGSNSDSCVSEA